MENESFIWNGKPRQPLQIPRQGVWSKLGKAVRTKLADMLLPVRLMIVIALLVLIALLQGCATPSTPPSETPRNPSLPPPQQSQPTEPYLSRVLRNIELWEQRLRATLPTP
jgi:hypothetical protein